MYQNTAINFRSDNTRLVVGACQGGGGCDVCGVHTAVKQGAVESCVCARAARPRAVGNTVACARWLEKRACACV